MILHILELLVEGQKRFREEWVTLMAEHDYSYTVLIVRDDGSTYEQKYREIEDLIDLSESLGEGYKICDVY